MPNMDGFELTQKLRQDDRYKHLPIMAVTSLHTDEDRQIGINAGVDKFLVKLNFDELLAVIKEFGEQGRFTAKVVQNG
jgi:two-component system chemotaxis sensor kinase CheA